MQKHQQTLARILRHSGWVHLVVYCIIGSLVWIFQMQGGIGTSQPPLIETDYQWMASFMGYGILEEELAESEKRFYSQFSGKVARFSLEGKSGEQIILRYVEKPDRRLHPAEECYKASGMKIEYASVESLVLQELSPLPLEWSQFVIEEDGRRYSILQTIYSLGTGAHYKDIQAWYWNALFSAQDRGPWLAVCYKREKTIK